MELLGSRLRHRRRQLKLRQEDVAGPNSASFLSKVENGVASPSLSNFEDWCEKLNITMGELLGDHLILEAAKHTILLTEKCHHYLNQIRPSTTTQFLRMLSESATSLSTPVPEPPDDLELKLLTAKVLLHRGAINEAKELLNKMLSLTYSPLLQIRCLSLLCLIYNELAEEQKTREIKSKLYSIIQELDHDLLLNTLPDQESLTFADLELLKLSCLAKAIENLAH